ncbi:MAG TPA: sulfite exporter TauE/SafE family protein, partial [Burkholderiales bacterium]|nr:sulfite exporter TauE/SafE family protein [Burkholderiales bacterium]
GAIRWDVFRAMTPGILIGGLIGAALASHIPSAALAMAFTAIIFVAATNMLLNRQPHASRQLPGWAGQAGVGAAIGGVSSIAAMGGGFASVPYMVWCNVPMIQAIGTAAALGFPIALAGTIGFVYNGLRDTGLPAWSLGYVYLPAMLGITVTSVLFAPLGAAAAHRLPTAMLKRIFAVLLYVLAIRMLVKIL